MPSSEALYLLLHALETANIYHASLEGIFVLTILTEQELSEYVNEFKTKVEDSFQAQMITKDSLMAYCEEKAEKDGISKGILFEMAARFVHWSSEEQGFLNNITRSEEHTSELQSRGHLVCRLLLEKKTVK